MLVIRLQRTGRKNEPTFRLVLTEKSAPMKSGEQEILGHYLPNRNPAEIALKQERVSYWISKGAIPSDTAARLLKKEGMKDMDKYIERYTKKRPKKEPPEAPAAAPAAPQEAAPAEEPKQEAAPEEAPAPQEAAQDDAAK